MKKFLLILVVALISLVSCADYTDDFNTINNRLDALEQAVPSIEEQIESINTQLTSLKATDEAIKKQIAELEKSDKATATEIADLKKKDSALEKSINDLQNYVDTQIANAKSEAAAAYATVEQYNTIVAQLNALQSSTSKLGEDLTAKINAEVKSLNDRIADLEARLEAVEDKVENLLARIQSVSYIPTYNDNKATLKYISGVSQVVLDFEVSPKDAVVELAKVWQDAVSIKAVYTQTRAVSFVDMPIKNFETDTVNGIISVTASGENLSAPFFAGTQTASVCMAISDGNNSVISEYIPMVARKSDINEIKIPANEIWYTSIGNIVVKPYEISSFDANIVSNTNRDGIGVVVFDAPITSIGEQAFYECSGLISVTIPDGVTTIGDKAFCGCNNLTSITIPNSVTLIEHMAFGNSSLISVIIPDSVTSINQRVFYNCRSLTSVTIPDSVTEIRLEAFEYCTSLTSVTIPDSVTSIGQLAFYNCTSLTSITIPDSVTSITERAFGECTALSSITIPNSVTSIGRNAFYGCTSLTSVTIPNSVSSIDSGAFSGCSNLKEFKGEHASSDGRCLIIDGVLFYCAPAGLTTEYTIPDSVTSIWTSAFSGCTSLTSITIPDSVTSIGTSTFNGCTSLKSVTIPDSVTSIGKNAFYGCTSLKSVTIGNSVTSIGQLAFYNCTSLTSVYCKPTIPPAISHTYGSNFVFPIYQSEMTIYVPRSAYDLYMQYNSVSYNHIDQKNWSLYEECIQPYDF